MATYLNVNKFGAYETLKALSPITFASGSGIFDGSNYFDTNTGTVWTVPNGTNGAIQIAPNGNYIYVDNTGTNTYADMVLEGERRAYITLASKVNNFYVVACGDKDDINGLGGLYLYNANNYNFILKIQHSTLVNKYLYPQLQPTYTWQSISSISGNDLTVNLVTLNSESINNGDPVSGASSSAFTKLPSAENNIKNLVDITLEPVATDNSVTIFYTIPSSDYTSIKLYGKIGETPNCDDTDDIIEDIDRNETSIVISDLNYESTYYFTIQCIDNDDDGISSNTESYTTANRITPREYRDAVTILTHMYAPGMDNTEFYDVTASGMSWNDSTKSTCSYYHNSQTLSNFYGWSSGLCYSSSALNINIDFVSASSTNYKVTITNCSNVKAWINTWSYDVDKSRSVCERVDIADGYARCNPVSNSWSGAGSYVSDYNNKTLTEIFTKLVNQFRNCNVYVNGIQWGQQGIGYL